MMKHFDFLYSECHTQEDKNHFLSELLALLRDPQEQKQQRLIFYSRYPSFAKDDRKRIRKKRIKAIIMLPEWLISRVFNLKM